MSIANSHVTCPCYEQCSVTVTEALVLRPLLEDRGHITESIRTLVPIDRMKNIFSEYDETKASPSISSVSSLFHARGAATEKASAASVPTQTSGSIHTHTYTHQD